MSKNINKNKTVFVGVSGGVDSSVSLALLKEAGYKVFGVFIRTWSPEWIECTWREERRDAMRVCAHLGVPFLECDAEKEYKKQVADYMIEEYKMGRTPNPDIMCNREIKFGVFWKFAKSRGADFIATGHYCQNKNFSLNKGFDVSKDQAYFLWKLNKKDLTHVLFPIGHLKKTDVRKLAKKFNLPTAIKKDSQGICMLGNLDIKDFLSHYIKIKKGHVLNEKGEIVGHHNGATFLTLGERHGFVMTKKTSMDGPYYIVSKDIKKNTITVSQQKNSININKNIEISNTNWIFEIPKLNKYYTVQVRYHGEYFKCQILEIKKSLKTAKLEIENHPIVASGQSVVFYDKDVCLGGGIVV